jgi:hypothetical protein
VHIHVVPYTFMYTFSSRKTWYLVRIRWILTAMWVWAKVTGKYCILSPPHEGTVEDRIHHKR